MAELIRLLEYVPKETAPDLHAKILKAIEENNVSA